MPHTFISYVREDAALAHYVAGLLQANGIEPWLDTQNIGVGHRWKDALRHAIQEGDKFVAIFTPARQRRDRSVAHEELRIAIDELRLRPRDRAWFLALSTEGGVIPNDDLGGGETLRDLQYLDVGQIGWPEAMKRLLVAHGVAEPAFEIGQPLAPGFGDKADIVGGNFVIRNFKPDGMFDAFEGAIFHIADGACERVGNHIVVAFNTSAPNEALQALNERLGFSQTYAVSKGPQVSTSRESPTKFSARREQIIPAGEILSLPGQPTVTFPVPLTCHMSFEAKGHLEGQRIVGPFTANWLYDIAGQPFRVAAEGDFVLEVRPAIRPPSLT